MRDAPLSGADGRLVEADAVLVVAVFAEVPEEADFESLALPAADVEEVEDVGEDPLADPAAPAGEDPGVRAEPWLEEVGPAPELAPELAPEPALELVPVPEDAPALPVLAAPLTPPGLDVLPVAEGVPGLAPTLSAVRSMVTGRLEDAVDDDAALLPGLSDPPDPAPSRPPADEDAPPEGFLSVVISSPPEPEPVPRPSLYTPLCEAVPRHQRLLRAAIERLPGSG
ncbi:hypothetical protein [Roseibium sp.]|uniref:hypothetical protein n=1 Tax=Roseibium sp. TaxID=1936156 RepID=UPI003263C0F8